MLILLVLLILLFLLGKSFLSMTFTAIGGAVGIILLLVLFLLKKRRS